MAFVAITVIAAVAYTLRPREAVTPAKPIGELDPKAKIVTIAGDFIEYEGARQDLKIFFKQQSTDQNDQTRLSDVKVVASNRSGRDYTITGNEMQVGKDESSFEVKGEVKLETSDGLVAHSEQATYFNTEKIVRAPGPVKFSRGRMSGTGVGFNFDEQRDMLMILDQANVHFAPEGKEGPMDVTAGAFTYARRDRFMRFERTMHMDRGGQLIDANDSTVKLYPDRDETDMIELRGNSRVTGGGTMGAVQTMSAKDMNLKYGEDGRTLQHATLAGSAVIDLATKSGTGGQKLGGELMNIALEPDGSVRTLSAREAVEVTLPATKEMGPRTIRSTSLSATGNAQGLRAMKFDEKIEYREAATKTQGARVVRARTLEADLESATGALAEAHFIGDVDVTDGPMHATSVDAVYKVAGGTMSLSGKERRPHVENDALSIDANAIDVTLNPRSLTATGRVTSTMLPSKKPSGNTPASNRPGLLADQEAVAIVAEKLTYDETTRKADYSGQVRLLQGDTSIQADALTIDETKGDLSANGKVMTTLLITEKDSAATTKPKPMVGRAAAFAYSDQNRTATYTTTAQLDGDQGNLRAVKIEMKLAKDENTLDGLEADGVVTALVDKRTITGTHLSYEPADDKYVVVGVPVKMLDADCQETSGKTLTFWKASDRVLVDGNNEVRTQTKGGGKCPATPPQYLWAPSPTGR
jgi:lipopolysaccharide transport protein LptA